LAPRGSFFELSKNPSVHIKINALQKKDVIFGQIGVSMWAQQPKNLKKAVF